MRPVRLSIVTTLYQSAPFVADFYQRCCTAAGALTADFEIVFVDDGSPDDSLEIAVGLYRGDPRVRVVSLSRNFGHHKALMTGMAEARGELVFLIDSDLEIDPAVLPIFAARLEESGADVVFGVQDVRSDPLIHRWASRMFYLAFNSLSRFHLPLNLTTARIMTRRYVSALLAHQEREMVIAGLWVITGYRQLPVTVTKSVARRGTTYDWPRKVVVLTNAITSFSDRPLVLIFWMGAGISFLAGAYSVSLIARRMLFGTIASGFLALIVSTWLLGGLTIFCLGVIGIYLSKIFIETKQRPYTIIRERYERPAGE